MGLLEKLFGSSDKKGANAAYSGKASRSRESTQETKARIALGDHQLEQAFKARDAMIEAEYSDESIERYLDTLKSATQVNMSKHWLDISDAYIRRQQYDKAWSYLNWLLLEKPQLLDGIRKEQCRICKKEKRWADALQFLLLQYSIHWVDGFFKQETFLRDLKPIANKLNLDDEERQYLADAMEKDVVVQQDKEEAAIKLYRSFYNERLANRQTG